jgi:uncharacterized protein YtpQ (UPF0354 family)
MSREKSAREASVFGLFRKQQPAEPSAEQIVPRIKHTNFLKTVREITAKEKNPGSLPVTQPLIADLLITYAFDLPHVFQMFTERDRQRLALSIDELRDKAIENLRKQLPPPTQKGQPPIIMLTVGNNLEACLLLIDELWEKFSKTVPGKLVVSVPTRDMILLTSSQSEAGLRVIREIAAEARKREPVHGLTESLLVWEEGRWRVFNQPEVD